MHRLTIVLILVAALAGSQVGCAFSKGATSYTFGQGSVTVTESLDAEDKPVTVTETKSEGISEAFSFGIFGTLVDADGEASVPQATAS